VDVKGALWQARNMYQWGVGVAKIVFVFDRVMHYHRALFERLDAEFSRYGHELVLLSGKEKESTTGRVALKKTVVKNQVEFPLCEWSFRSFMFRYQHGVAKKIHEIQPAIVVTTCHSGTFSEWQIANLKKQLNFKLVAWQCGYEFNPGSLKRWVLGKFIPHFDHHLAYHTNAKHYAISHGARADQVMVMHNTINEERIVLMPKAEAQALVRDKHPSIANRKIILFVGAVLAEKRVELILQALDLMQRKDAVLVLVGDGEHLPAIRQLCTGRDDVVLPGSIVEGVGPYFDAAEMYVLPGTGGLGINEAMAHRLPIVSGYADGSADDLVVDGENGYRLRDNTPQELAEKMAMILDDPALAQRMGERSREMITGKFAFREFISRIVTELTRLAR
jgi:glycosyltransferase involved in cell wall biosynthesis